MDPAELKSKNPLFLGALLLILVVAAIYITSPLTVTVTGTGQASVPATNATVSFSVSANDTNSPQNAILNVNAKALAMRTYLKTKGVLDSDIAESQVTAVPSSLVTSGATGYQATISMAAKTTNVGDITSLVSGLYAQGAYVVGQPLLSVDNQNKVDNQAFDAAMTDAKSQAGRIGLSNLKFFRKVVAISQVTSPSTSTSSVKSDSTGADANNGVFKIVKAVSVTYKMW